MMTDYSKKIFFPLTYDGAALFYPGMYWLGEEYIY